MRKIEPKIIIDSELNKQVGSWSMPMNNTRICVQLKYISPYLIQLFADTSITFVCRTKAVRVIQINTPN